MTSPLVVEGTDEVTSAVQVAMVTERYFDVMRIDLLRGTGFDGEDREGGLPRMIVDQGVRKPDGTVLDVGDRAHSFFGAQGMQDVVGVVRSVRHRGLRELPTPIVYRPFFQAGGASAFALLVRSDAPSPVVADAARALVGDIAPDVPNDRVASMSAHVRRSLVEPRFYVVGLSTFGVLAVLLALAGCQAGLAHRVAARRKEIGLRMALGASSPQVRSLVLRRGVTLTGVGAALGLGAAVPAARVLESQLYGVAPTDPLTHGAVFLFLVAAGALASDLPARRAASVDPAETLRES
jgi:hypothetical protein